MVKNSTNKRANISIVTHIGPKLAKNKGKNIEKMHKSSIKLCQKSRKLLKGKYK